MHNDTTKIPEFSDFANELLRDSITKLCTETNKIGWSFACAMYDLD